MALCYFLIFWVSCCVTPHIVLSDGIQRLDSFNCLWTQSSQFAANEKTVRVNKYDLIGPLSSLIGHYHGLDNYLGSASTEWSGALECEDSAQCMQLGQPIRFQEIKSRDPAHRKFTGALPYPFNCWCCDLFFFEVTHSPSSNYKHFTTLLTQVK